MKNYKNISKDMEDLKNKINLNKLIQKTAPNGCIILTLFNNTWYIHQNWPNSVTSVIKILQSTELIKEMYSEHSKVKWEANRKR